MTRAFQGGRGGHLAHLAERNSEIMGVLNFFASEQRNLIALASEVLHKESAVRLVKGLLPAMLEEPLPALVNAVRNHEVAEAPGPAGTNELPDPASVEIERRDETGKFDHDHQHRPETA